MNRKTWLATLFERVCAFLIDIIIVFFVVSIIVSPFQKNYDSKYSEELDKTMEEYTNNKISSKVFLYRTSDIKYDITRQQGLSIIIEVVIYILYFVVLQYKLEGQTLGKKIMRIRIDKTDDSKLEINDLIFRSLLINSILFNIILLCIVFFTNKDIYLYGNYILLFLQYAFLLLSVIFIVVKKDKQGLHDMIAHTIVVKTN